MNSQGETLIYTSANKLDCREFQRVILNVRKQHILFFTGSLLLSSCAIQNPSLPSAQSAALVELNLHKELAHNAYKSNRFHESLHHWKKLNELYPDNQEFQDRIFILNKLIKRRVKIGLDKANQAMKRNEYAVAVNEFEKTLILDPTNNVAIKYLAQLNRDEKNRNNLIPDSETTNEIIENSTFKTDETNSDLALLEDGLDLIDQREWAKAVIPLKKYIKHNPEDDIAKNYLSNAHVQLSKEYYKKRQFQAAMKHFEFAINYSSDNKIKLTQELKSLKLEIAHHYYIEGAKAYKTNKKLALSFWKKTLKYNPNHLSANARLKKETDNTQ